MRCSRTRRIWDDSGQAAPLVAVLLLGLVAMVALVVDAGLVLTARRDLQGIADGAARAGAMEIDVAHLRVSGGQEVKLDAELARAQVEEYLAQAGFEGKVTITTSSSEVTVVLEYRHKALMMGMAGIREVGVRASSTARPRSGIEGPE